MRTHMQSKCMIAGGIILIICSCFFRASIATGLDKVNGWVYVDNGEKLNYGNGVYCNTTSNSNALFNGKAYITWTEDGHVRVKEYNGVSWPFVDGNDSYGLNLYSDSVSERSSIIVCIEFLFVAWDEY